MSEYWPDGLTAEEVAQLETARSEDFPAVWRRIRAERRARGAERWPQWQTEQRELALQRMAEQAYEEARQRQAALPSLMYDLARRAVALVERGWGRIDVMVAAELTLLQRHYPLLYGRRRRVGKRRVADV